jgi:hypothetical protein
MPQPAERLRVPVVDDEARARPPGGSSPEGSAGGKDTGSGQRKSCGRDYRTRDPSPYLLHPDKDAIRTYEWVTQLLRQGTDKWFRIR